jgi:hypothetical protein
MKAAVPASVPFASANSHATILTPLGPRAGVVFLHAQAGRPLRQYQWSIGIQREFFKNLALDVSYVGNRGVSWQGPSLVDVNAVTPAILAANGFNLNDPSQQTLLFGGTGANSLLSTPLSAVSPAVAAQYNLRAPYTGFSGSQTVAQAFRPFPQFGNMPVSGDPRGKDMVRLAADQIDRALVAMFDRNV